MGVHYMDLIGECEKLGDYIVNVVEARTDMKEKKIVLFIFISHCSDIKSVSICTNPRFFIELFLVDYFSISINSTSKIKAEKGLIWPVPCKP